MEKMNKKGQLGGLQGIIVTVLIVGLLLGCGYLVLEKLQVNLSTDYSKANITIAPTDAGVYTYWNSTNTALKCFSDFQVTSAVNATGGPLSLAGNYSWDSDTGRIWNTSAGVALIHSWNVSITYKTGGEACEGVRDTITATNNINTFLPIIVIVGIVGILLAIVFLALPKSGVGGRVAEV